MAEKEERILIARSTDYTLTDTDKGELFEGKIAPHCANVFTRQEAIERINHAICVEVHGNCDKCDKKKYNLGYPCNDYKRYAEAALNALLEGK